MRNLSFLYEMQQRLQDSERLQRAAVDLSIETYGLEHDVTLVSLNGLGRVLRATGQLDDAERVFRDATDATRKLYGSESLELAHDAHNLATVLRERHQYEEAIELFREALAIRRRLLPQPDDVETGRTLQGLGLCLLETGRGPQAVPLLREALAIRIKAFGATHMSVALVQAGLGAAVASTGAYEEAERLLLPAWEMLGRGSAASLQPREREGIRRSLYQLYESWGKPDKAAEYVAVATSQPATARP
jgi:tetratricopeptide (TPR) repeat protein